MSLITTRSTEPLPKQNFQISQILINHKFDEIHLTTLKFIVFTARLVVVLNGGNENDL